MASRLRPYIRSVIASSIIFVICACAGPGRFLETPHISMARIRIQEIGLLEQVYQVELRVVNPNEVPLAINGLDCTLTINDTKFANGVSTVETSIPALGTGTIPIILYASLPEVIKILKNMQEGAQLKYTVTGKLHTGGLLLPPTIPYTFKGVYSLQGTKDEE